MHTTAERLDRLEAGIDAHRRDLAARREALERKAAPPPATPPRDAAPEPRRVVRGKWLAHEQDIIDGRAVGVDR